MRSDAQKKSLHAAEQQRPDVAAARENWRAAQPHLDPDRLVFIDETWATTNMTRRYGRAPPGQRLVAAVPHGHWKTSTFVAGLRTNGLTAPLIVDGAINGDIFRAYVEQVLAPTLRPGDMSSWTISAVTRSPVCATRSRPVAPPSFACRPTAPTEIRSSKPSPSSKPCCESSPRAPSQASGTPSVTCSIASPPGMRQLSCQRRICSVQSESAL